MHLNYIYLHILPTRNKNILRDVNIQMWKSLQKKTKLYWEAGVVTMCKSVRQQSDHNVFTLLCRQQRTSWVFLTKRLWLPFFPALVIPLLSRNTLWFVWQVELCVCFLRVWAVIRWTVAKTVCMCVCVCVHVPAVHAGTGFNRWMLLCVWQRKRDRPAVPSFIVWCLSQLVFHSVIHSLHPNLKKRVWQINKTIRNNVTGIKTLVQKRNINTWN